MIRLVVAVARACHRHHSCSCSLPTSQLFVLALVVAVSPSVTHLSSSTHRNSPSPIGFAHLRHASSSSHIKARHQY
ncbi:hypothetical protein AB3S75_017579 [Citrus x aurantiifolia]